MFKCLALLWPVAVALTSCSALASVPLSSLSFPEALKKGVSFTEYAATSQVILKNEGGCDRLSGGWQDDAGIQNLLFVGDPQSQKWAVPGKHVQDTVGMALFWARQVRFVFACEHQGQLTYHNSPWGKLDRAVVVRNGNNLVLSSKRVDGQLEFTFNYPFVKGLQKPTR